MRSKCYYIRLIALVLGVGYLFGQDKRPNIVFILTDDQRYDMLGCTGNTIVLTPNIDWLAEKGTLFTKAHVSSAICTPSRTSILLGQFERKHGVNFNSGTSVSDEAWRQSYPSILRRSGYYTGYIGKNHTPIGEGGYESGVMEKSYDYWYAGHKHLGFYPKKKHSIFKNARNNTQIEVLGEGVDDFLDNKHQLKGAKHFIDQRPADKPFFLNLCFNLPHDAGTSTMLELDSDPAIYKEMYRDLKEIPLPPNYVAHSNITVPKLPATIHFAGETQGSYDYAKSPGSVKERIIRQMQTITGIDVLVGDLLRFLKNRKLDDNTIIIFTSDHGLFMGEFGLRGKSLCYEICTHVPMVIYDPKVKSRARGQRVDELVQNIDIAPTILSYAGVESPETFQGQDLSDLIKGDIGPIRDFLFTENLWSTQFGNPRCESVQNKTWKYIRYYKNENLRASDKMKVAKMLGISEGDMFYKQHDSDIAQYRVYVESSIKGEPAVYEELYHLERDPGEINNLARTAEFQYKLMQMREVWREKIEYARGKGNPKVYRYTVDSQLARKKGRTGK